MAFEALMLALLLGAGGDSPQEHAAPKSHPAPAKPAAAEPPPHAPVAPSHAPPAPPKAPAATKKAGDASDLIKLAAELKAARENTLKSRADRVTSRPRGLVRPGLAPPAAPRYRLQWPPFEPRWQVTWPQPPSERLALVWPD